MLETQNVVLSVSTDYSLASLLMISLTVDNSQKEIILAFSSPDTIRGLLQQLEIDSTNSVLTDLKRYRDAAKALKVYKAVLRSKGLQSAEIDFIAEGGKTFNLMFPSTALNELVTALHHLLQESYLRALPATFLARKAVSTVEIYLPGEDIPLSDSEKITSACGEFMEALGFEMKAEEEPIYNSFWKRLVFIFKKNVTPDEVEQVFRKGKKALELKYVELPTAEQTEKLATAAEKINNILEKFDKGAVRLGSILMIKGTSSDGKSNLIVHQLSSDEILELEKNPTLIKNIEALINMVTADGSFFGHNTPGLEPAQRLLPGEQLYSDKELLPPEEEI